MVKASEHSTKVRRILRMTACAEPFYVINNLPRSHLSGLIVAVLEMFPLRNTLIMTLIIDKNLPQVRKKRADCAEHKHINHRSFVL